MPGRHEFKKSLLAKNFRLPDTVVHTVLLPYPSPAEASGRAQRLRLTVFIAPLFPRALPTHSALGRCSRDETVKNLVMRVLIRSRLFASCTVQGWRDGSSVRNTGCFSRKLEFDSLQPPRCLTTTSNFSSRGSSALFWPS